MSAVVNVMADLLLGVLLVAAIVSSVALSRRIARLKADESAMRKTVAELMLATELWQAELKVEAVLHEMRAPLKQVLALQVGDTLMFDARPNELVTLRCGDWTLAQGRVGRIDDAIAVQLVRPLRRSRTTIAAFEASMTNQREGLVGR